MDHDLRFMTQIRGDRFECFTSDRLKAFGIRFHTIAYVWGKDRGYAVNYKITNRFLHVFRNSGPTYEQKQGVSSLLRSLLTLLTLTLLYY